MPLTASARLKNALNSLVPISGKYGPLWTHERLRELYPRYLVTLHTVIRSSVPIMIHACEVELRSGRGQLAEYLSRHITEELHHDEWLIEDLESIGIPRDDIFDQVPSPTVAAMAGAQYYYIYHYRPVATLGYIARLEAYPPTDNQIQAAIRVTGYPESAFGCLRTHAKDDPHHRDELFDVIDGLPLDESGITAITTNAMATAERCSIMIGEIVSQSPLTFLPSERNAA